jgi:glycosyltransferase involved in cell wall biosynthesis
MRILHVFRAPVGGLFRHVRDLARGQSELGHDVGMLCDSTTGGGVADALLNAALPHCSLGIKRIEISRLPGLGDVSATLKTKAHGRDIGADIIHCHGAKGGLYGRLAARALGVPSVYTPHGGSLHYRWLAFPGVVFLATEWVFARFGTGLIFVCAFERQSFADKIGFAGKANTIVYNGLWPEEFVPVVPDHHSADVLFMGDMRMLKGVDVLLDALALVGRKRSISANLVGDGPDLAQFQMQAGKLGLSDRVKFLGRLPTAAALRCGKLLVMPSRAESFPYVVLEAAAGRIPMIASNVGGIPEVLPPENLCPPGNADALARHIDMALAIPQSTAQTAAALADEVKSRFGAAQMAKNVLSFYAELRAH